MFHLHFQRGKENPQVKRVAVQGPASPAIKRNASLRLKWTSNDEQRPPPTSDTVPYSPVSCWVTFSRIVLAMVGKVLATLLALFVFLSAECDTMLPQISTQSFTGIERMLLFSLQHDLVWNVMTCLFSNY